MKRPRQERVQRKTSACLGQLGAPRPFLPRWAFPRYVNPKPADLSETPALASQAYLPPSTTFLSSPQAFLPQPLPSPHDPA